MEWIMYQEKTRHALSAQLPALPDDVTEAMWNLFTGIGGYWVTTVDSTPFKSRLHAFMSNRIALMPLYADYYVMAKRVISELSSEKGSDSEAIAVIIASPQSLDPLPTTALALTRQFVVNEFTTLHMALGGFKAFGAINWPGYFGGANVPGKPPYRTEA